MSNRNIWATNRPDLFKKQRAVNNKSSNKLSERNELIIINLMVFGGYTFISALCEGVAPVVNVVFLFVHVIICLILAVTTKKWLWALMGIVVLIIGFFTCIEPLMQMF